MFDDYLGDLGQDDRRALAIVVDHVQSLVPDAEEGVSYGLPAFRYRGKPLLGFNAAKDHLALYPFSPAVIEAVQDRLDGFAVSKGTVRFSPDHPVPPAVVARMVEARRMEIDG